MTFEANNGLGVNAHYGPRGVQDGVASGGKVQKNGSVHEAVVYISGDDFAGGTSYNTQLELPAGAIPIDATFEVTEAFTLGNADNVFNVGTDTSESTNGLALANPDALGTTEDATPAGTWAAALAADTSVGVSVTGTTAAVTAGVGKAKAVIRYKKI